MIEVAVSDEILIEARRQAVEMGKLHGSITGGQGNVAGFVGELIATQLLKATQKNTYNYDLILSNDSTVDVKTKRTSVTPLPHYECSVARLSGHQTCDNYAFMRVKNDYSIAWFLGLITRDKFYELARYMQKGDLDPDNGYVVKSTCYNLSIEDLWKVSTHANST
tara:strand:- start:364 stop:858 length:495 start_codon:yes stop_codon:yes gene_type:complete